MFGAGFASYLLLFLILFRCYFVHSPIWLLFFLSGISCWPFFRFCLSFFFSLFCLNALVLVDFEMGMHGHFVQKHCMTSSMHCTVVCVHSAQCAGISFVSSSSFVNLLFVS